MRRSAATINRDLRAAADPNPAERSPFLAITRERKAERLDASGRAGAEIQHGAKLVAAQLHARAVSPVEPAVLRTDGEGAVPGEDRERLEQACELLDLVRR